MIVIKENTDLHLVSESKIDDYFDSRKFPSKEPGTPQMLDQNKNGERMMLFVSNDIPLKILSKEKLPAEYLLIKFMKASNRSSNPSNGNNTSHVDSLFKILDTHLKK